MSVTAANMFPESWTLVEYIISIIYKKKKLYLMKNLLLFYG